MIFKRHLTVIAFFSALAAVTPAAFAGNFQKGVEHSNRGEYSEAAELLKKAIAEDSSNQGAYLALGIALINMHRANEALPYIERAVQLDPRSRKAFFILARLYEGNNQANRAIDAWEKYLTLNPSGKYHRIALRHLERLKENNGLHK